MARPRRARVDWLAAVARPLDELDQELAQQGATLATKKPSRTADRTRQFHAQAVEQLRHARAALAHDPRAARAAYHALQAHALARYLDAQLGIAHRRAQAERSRQGVHTKRDERSRDDDALRRAIAAVRATRPSATIRSIATALLSRWGNPYTTAPEKSRAIDALRKRLERLDGEK
ncbi:MAG: hypothetical protein H0X64_08315 [Gemmatimonadaceae bacterium]|nr:hypothetical protein [Gemmatimonadaceae bacterium]